MSDTIRFHRDTATGWTTANPVLDAGEPGFETDTLKLKIGDGVTHWTSLAYQGLSGVAGVTSVDTHAGVVTAAQLRTSLAAVLTPADIGAAPLAGPALTGTPTAPTQSLGDDSTRLATTAYVLAAIADAIANLTPADIGALWAINFGSNPATARGAVGGTALWIGAAGVTPVNTDDPDAVLNAT